jgi:hypothetical protein
MSKLTRKRKSVIGKVETGKSYQLADAAKLVKDVTTTKFDSSVDIAVRLGVRCGRCRGHGARRRVGGHRRWSAATVSPRRHHGAAPGPHLAPRPRSRAP